jgi:hypothetical protein
MRRAPVVFALLVLAACNGDAPPTAPGGAPDPSAIVIDGNNNGGNSHLFFLPPVVDNPNAFFTAPADASLFPRVEICEWDVVADSCVEGGTKFTYTTTTGPGGAVVQVFSDHYQVDWDTQLPGVDVGIVFRARILLVGQELGSVDLQLADNGKEVKNLDENLAIGLVDNRTLPLNFRIEEGAVEEVEEALEDTSPGGACQDEFDNVIDCDVEIIDANEGGTATVDANPGDEDETVAASVLIQPDDAVDANGDPVSDFQITLQHVADAPSEDLSADTQIPFFIDLTAVDGNGDPVFFLSGAELTLCNPPDLGNSEAGLFVPNELHHSLRIFRVTGAGDTEILETGVDEAGLCGGGIHGGLNTVLTSFSGFGTVLPTVPSLSTAVVPDGLVGVPTVIDIQAMVESNEHANELEPDLCLDDGTACEQVFGDDEVVVTITGANTETLTVGAGIVDHGDGTYTASYTPTAAGSDNVVIEIRNIDTGNLEQIKDSPFTSVVSAPAPDVTFTANLSSTILEINGPAVPYSGTITNNGSTSLSTVVIQAWVEQGPTLRAGGGAQVTCGPTIGTLPPGACNYNRIISASDQPPTAGSGTFVPGPAEAVIHLRLDALEVSTVLQEIRIPITLVIATFGTISDPAGDAASGEPDLTSATLSSDGTNLTLSVLFVPGTFDAATTMVSFVLDTDQNTATGFAGIDAANNDADKIGLDYQVQMGSNFVGSTLRIQAHTGSGFALVANSVPITFLPDGIGMEATLPLALLGGDDGLITFKVLSQRQLSASGFTGIQDYVTDVGLPAGETVVGGD